jgi:hypothetical protein
MSEQSPLRFVDRFQIVTTALILVVGAVILFRSMALHTPIDSYGLGAAFLFYGIYRLRFIIRALWKRRERP